MSYDHPCLSSVYSCVLLLALCIIVVSGVALLYVCDLLVYWVRLCFRLVVFVLLFVLFLFSVVAPWLPMRTL